MKPTVAVTLLGGLLLLGACAPRKNTGAKQASSTGAAQAVRMVTATQGALRSRRNTSVIIDPGETSAVAAGTSGRVQRVVRPQGSQVNRGQVVVQLDPTTTHLQAQNAELALKGAQLSLSRAQSSFAQNVQLAKDQLSAAQSSLAIADKQYTEGQALFKVGGISAVNLKQLENATLQARAGLQSARNALQQAQEVQKDHLKALSLQVQQSQYQLKLVQRNLAETGVAAPFAGVVTQVNVDPGEFVGTGSAVFHLAKMSTLKAKFNLPPEQAAALSIGETVQVRYAGRTYGAVVTNSSTIPMANRLVQMVARLDGPELPPVGVTATLDYTAALAKGSLVPVGAVRFIGNQAVVLVVQGGKAVSIPVRLVAQNGTQVALEGLQAGDSIIYPLPPGLTDGQAVKVVP